jgi:hypothetical protein
VKHALEIFFADRKRGEFKLHSADMETPVRKV